MPALTILFACCRRDNRSLPGDFFLQILGSESSRGSQKQRQIMRSLPDDNLSYPVLLETRKSSGSGFYFRTDQKIFLVTAKHVLYGEDNKLRDTELKTTSYDKDLSITAPIEFFMDLTKLNIRENNLSDIALIEVAKISTENHITHWLEGVKKSKTNSKSNFVVVPPRNLKKFNDVLVSNDVFILGYPSSLGGLSNTQIEPKKPLLRKGIIAGKNMANGTIILDCPVYFGNSGGMAIEVEDVSSEIRYRVIGVVSQFVPFVEELKSKQLGYTNLNFENSGYSIVVPIDAILELAKETVN